MVAPSICRFDWFDVRCATYEGPSASGSPCMSLLTLYKSCNVDKHQLIVRSSLTFFSWLWSWLENSLLGFTPCFLRALSRVLSNCAMYFSTATFDSRLKMLLIASAPPRWLSSTALNSLSTAFASASNSSGMLTILTPG
ncbi:hypothetical protein MBLNU230_g3533t1 [Neophaeotheca triangularis]